jgi:hypothetical protein
MAREEVRHVEAREVRLHELLFSAREEVEIVNRLTDAVR